MYFFIRFMCFVIHKLFTIFSECPEGTEKFRNHCYFPSFKGVAKAETPPRNWKDARDFCKEELPKRFPNMTYDLVSLQDADEYEFLISNDWSELYQTYKESFAIWIGLNDLEKEDDWRWSDGSSFEYPIPGSTPWLSSEPNNHGVCTLINKQSI